jgi:vitamin B12 transporter
MKRLLLSTCLALSGAAVLAGPALAADDANTIDEAVVTATRLPSLLDQAPGAKVITSDDIEQRQAVFAADVLDTVPGLSVSRNGAFGGITSVRIRGASPDKTLVLVDGVPMNDPSDPNGAYDFANFDLDDVDRIEILSGPQGSIWGSQAIGGVISFTTRELNGMRAGVEGGSFGTGRGYAGAGVATDAYAFGADVSGLTTDGISKAATGSEKDGFWDYTVGAYGRVRLAEGLQLDGRVRYVRSRADVDGFPPPFFVLADTDDVANSETWSGVARLRYDGGWGLHHTLSVSLFDISRTQDGESGFSHYTGERQVYRYMVERGDPTDPWGFALGAERDDDTARLSDGSKQDLSANSLFGVLRVRPIDRLNLTGSLRWDDPDAYGSKTTGRVAGVFDLGWGLALKASWGQGFKTPTISELACDFCSPSGPSLNLRPEMASGYDLGLAWRSHDGRYSAEVTGYRLDVHDQIAFTFDPITFASRYANIDRTRTLGVEVQADAELGAGFKLHGAYAYTDAQDRSATPATWLLRVPRNQASAVLSWQGGKIGGALTVRAEGKQADSDPDTFAATTRPGFVTADLAGSYEVRPGIKLTARVENLFDKTYQQILGYGEPGIAGYVGVRFSR